jgi:iron-sulfur cluster assembly protein
MLTLTPAAAEQVRLSAEKGGAQGMALRIAARRLPEGTLDYAMGFDNPTDEDAELLTEGVRVLIAPEHAQLLKGTTLDYVELDEPGRFHFIFLNPNDPNYSPPPAG